MSTKISERCNGAIPVNIAESTEQLEQLANAAGHLTGATASERAKLCDDARQMVLTAAAAAELNQLLNCDPPLRGP